MKSSVRRPRASPRLPFPYVAHSRGWTAEDMERNVEIVCES
ncbi:MAG: hypothetical protein ACKVXR_08575 [Planctomycetota bacterium]